jgi:large conductance mechanosensitive channel
MEGAIVFKEFKEFINRGNVVDLAVAVVIGAAFTAIVRSFTEDVIDPLLAAVGGQPNFDKVGIVTLNNAEFHFGELLTAIVEFLIIAFVMFLVVKMINRMQERRASEVDEKTETEIELLTQIRDELVAARRSGETGTDGVSA